jgi:hypothetical protein
MRNIVRQKEREIQARQRERRKEDIGKDKKGERKENIGWDE